MFVPTVAGAGPATVPSAPRITSVTAGVESVTVAFARPASNGGARILQYKATCVSSDGGVGHFDNEPGPPVRVVHLSGAKTYTCTVAARNQAGLGPASAPSQPVVTVAAPPVAVPGPPVITSATAVGGTGKNKINLVFDPPVDNGNAKILDYRSTCTSNNGGATRIHNGLRSPILADHLSANRRYTCTIVARNRAGFGAPSAKSRALVVFPHPKFTFPSGPVMNGVLAGSHRVQVFFGHPKTDGGQPILRYRAVCKSSDGGVSRSSTQR